MHRMSFVRAAIILTWATLASVSCFAGDASAQSLVDSLYGLSPRFRSDEATFAFLGSAAGGKLIRAVVGLPDTAKLVPPHYARFLNILSLEQNQDLAVELNVRLFYILQNTTSGEGEGDPVEVRKATILAAAEQELSVARVTDLAAVARTPLGNSPTRELRRLAIAAAQEASQGSVLDTLDLPSNIFARNQMSRWRLTRDFAALLRAYLFEPKDGVLPRPAGMNDQETREYQTVWVDNARAFVRAWGGFSELARAKWIYRLMAEVDSNALGSAMLDAQPMLRSVHWGTSNADEVMAELEKLAKGRNLPPVTFEAGRRILKTIWRLTILGGEEADGRYGGKLGDAIAQFQKCVQEVSDLEQEVASGRNRIKELQTNRKANDLKIRKIKHNLFQPERNLNRKRKELRAKRNAVINRYAEFSQLLAHVEFINDLANLQGLPDTFRVKDGLYKHWLRMEAEGMSSQLSDEINAKLFSEAIKPLFTRWVGRDSTKKFAKLMDEYIRQVNGGSIYSSSSMAELTRYVTDWEARLKQIGILTGKLTALSAVLGGLISQFSKVQGLCQQALEMVRPLLPHIGGG